VGGMAFLFYYGRLKKWPSGRIFDFFALALLASLPLGFFCAQALINIADVFIVIIMPVIYMAMLLFFMKVLLPLNVRGEIKDGSLGFLFLMIFSFTSLFARIVRSDDTLKFFTQIDTILLLLLFFFALFFLFLQEKGIKKNKGKNGREEKL